MQVALAGRLNDGEKGEAQNHITGRLKKRRAEKNMSEAAKNPNPFELLIEQIRAVVREEIAAANANVAKELLEPEELATALKVPVSWVYEQSRQGNIPTRRIGRYIRFGLAEVLESKAAKKRNTP